MTAVDEEVHKIWYKCIVEYYLAFKKREILTRVKTWMNFKEIILCGISQTQKEKYCVISFT